MSLINFQNIFVNNEETFDRKVNVYIFAKSENKYQIFDDNNNQKQEQFLMTVCADNSVGECHVDYSDENGEIKVLVCIGDSNGDDFKLKDNVLTAGASLHKNLSHMKGVVSVEFRFKFMLREFVNGFILASYKYLFLKKDKIDLPRYSLVSTEADISEYVALSNAQNFARFLSDTPANLMTPTLFVEYAKEYLKGTENVSLEAFDENYIKDQGMNLFLSVSHGSFQEPKLLSIYYKGKSSDDNDVCLVGKGITFDSGGISLKPSASMSEMKGDMSGGSAVLSIIKLLSDFKVKCNARVIIPLTENMPGGKATKPGDVFVGMNGKSVEVDNTDAEGRLILGDALTFAQKYNPKYLIDIATLTGAMGISLGDSFIGYFTNDESFSIKIKEASLLGSDIAWPMPLSSLYLSAMKSNVADLKNAGGKKGGSATAAAFLSEFVEKGIKWAHIDIAGVMCGHQNKLVYGNGMTGKGVSLLYDIVKAIIS